MNDLHGFLSFLENKPANLKNIYRYNYKTGKKYFDYCIRYGLITNKKGNSDEELKNSVGETLYRLTDKAIELQKNKNFIERLKQMESEGTEK